MLVQGAYSLLCSLAQTLRNRSILAAFRNRTDWYFPAKTLTVAKANQSTSLRELESYLYSRKWLPGCLPWHSLRNSLRIIQKGVIFKFRGRSDQCMADAYSPYRQYWIQGYCKSTEAYCPGTTVLGGRKCRKHSASRYAVLYPHHWPVTEVDEFVKEINDALQIIINAQRPFMHCIRSEHKLLPIHFMTMV